MKKRLLFAAALAAGLIPLFAYAYPPFQRPGIAAPTPIGSAFQSVATWVHVQVGNTLRLGNATARMTLWEHEFVQQHCPNGYALLAQNSLLLRERMWHNQQGINQIVFTARNVPAGNFSQYVAMLRTEAVPDQIEIDRLGVHVMNGVSFWGAHVIRRPATILSSLGVETNVNNEGPWPEVGGAAVSRSPNERDFIPLCRRQQGGRCGDEEVSSDLGEQCDDGNTVNGDGCDEDCQIEGGSSSSSSSDSSEDTTVVTECGNGAVETGEQCDDGNTDNGDGCSDICLDESAPQPGSDGSCGDGTAQTWNGEQCDDGNTDNGDGCSSGCMIEFCGDGTVQSGLGEQCDDGNTTDDDGCSATCKLEMK